MTLEEQLAKSKEIRDMLEEVSALLGPMETIAWKIEGIRKELRSLSIDVAIAESKKRDKTFGTTKAPVTEVGDL